MMFLWTSASRMPACTPTMQVPGIAWPGFDAGATKRSDGDDVFVWMRDDGLHGLHET